MAARGRAERNITRLLAPRLFAFAVVLGVVAGSVGFAAAAGAADTDWLRATPHLREHHIHEVRVSGRGNDLQILQEGDTFVLSHFSQGITSFTIEADWPFWQAWHSAYFILLRGSIGEVPQRVAQKGAPLAAGEDYWFEQWGWTGSTETHPSTLFIPNTGAGTLPKFDASLPEGIYTMVQLQCWDRNSCPQSLSWFASGGTEGVAPRAFAALSFRFQHAAPSPAPAACCSSVLFLPGFTGSRLAREGWFGTTQLWEPRVGASWRWDDLAMDPETGVVPDDSIKASEVISESNVLGVQTPLGLNMYKGFLNKMEELVAEGTIREFRPFAYDWRRSLPLLVTRPHHRLGGVEEDLIAVVREMAQRSKTGKVSIVAHSMGGLVAKLLLDRLAQEGHANLVDRVIFVGTPHKGAPKAIAALLHGFDGRLGGGLVLRQSVARELLQTMESAYTLLPFYTYPSEAPLVYFQLPPQALQEEGPPIPPGIRGWFVDRASRQLPAPRTLDQFLTFPLAFPPLHEAQELQMSSIDVPRAVSTLILQNARAVQEGLAQWEPPAGVEVINIAGVGQPTPVAFRYTILPEYAVGHNTKAQDLISQALHIKQWRFVVEPIMSYEGDGTAPLASATLGSSEGHVNSRLFDLSAVNRNRVFWTGAVLYQHDNILDNQQFVNFALTNLLVPTDGSRYLSTTNAVEQQVFTKPDVKIVGIHSPLRPAGMSEGENNWWLQLSSIPIWRLGSSTYIALEPGESIELHATGEGGATLSFSPVDGDPQQPPTLLTHIPVASSTRGFLSLATTSATLLWDYDGDGVFETKQTINTNAPSAFPFQAEKTQPSSISDWEAVAREALNAYLAAVDASDMLSWRKRLYSHLVYWSRLHLDNRAWRLGYTATRAAHWIVERRFTAGDITPSQYAALEPHLSQLLAAFYELFKTTWPERTR